MTTKPNSIKPKSNWRVPILLLVLGSLNILFGALQLDTIQRGPPAVPDEFTTMQYFATPIPIVLHIVSGILLNLLSPFQFVPSFRQRWPGWHRWSGRLLILSGFLAALTGLWMNQFFPAYGGVLKYPGIIVNSLGLMVSFSIALRVILVGDVQRHRAWMMRAVAFGLGPATQRLFILPYFLVYGIPSDFLIGFIIWLGFLLNLAVVEWVLWRERSARLDPELGQTAGQINASP